MHLPRFVNSMAKKVIGRQEARQKNRRLWRIRGSRLPGSERQICTASKTTGMVNDLSRRSHTTVDENITGVAF